MSNPTLIMGCTGRMGRRYGAILNAIGERWDGYDTTWERTPYPPLGEYERVIIATPTNTHYDLVDQCIQAGVKMVLCEKPMCMDSGKVERLLDAVIAADRATSVSMVCNWSYVFPWRLWPRSNRVTYGNWYTGPHGGAWDCCQLYYLDVNNAPKIDNSPIFHAEIDGHPVTLADIDRSYIAMVKDWYDRHTRLWDLNDALLLERIIEGLPCAQS